MPSDVRQPPPCTVVQLAVDAGIPFDPGALSADVSKAVSWVHLSGTLHDTVAAQPERYLHPSPQLGALLGAARAGGKKLFLLTNSALGFVDKGMRFLVGDNWQQHFDVVITSAHKPAFYTSDSAFRMYSSNVRVAIFEPVTLILTFALTCCRPYGLHDCQRDFVKWSPARASDLEEGRILIGGSLEELVRLTGWSGRQVLYVGDHLHADLREPRREAGWATAAIVRELEKELEVSGLYPGVSYWCTKAAQMCSYI